MTSKDKAKKTTNYKTNVEIKFPSGVTKPKKGGKKTKKRKRRKRNKTKNKRSKGASIILKRIRSRRRNY
tara:strand:- start:43 stop:249 length:207 start_codon:yes stop_codon:yes gene_type:complete